MAPRCALRNTADRCADGVERLYLSPMPRPPGEPIRGGIPVVSGRFYFGVADPLTLHNRAARVAIRHDRFRDVVVWNPGAHPPAPLPGLPPDGYRQFVCVEALR